MASAPSSLEGARPGTTVANDGHGEAVVSEGESKVTGEGIAVTAPFAGGGAPPPPFAPPAVVERRYDPQPPAEHPSSPPPPMLPDHQDASTEPAKTTAMMGNERRRRGVTEESRDDGGGEDPSAPVVGHAAPPLAPMLDHHPAVVFEDAASEGRRCPASREEDGGGGGGILPRAPAATDARDGAPVPPAPFLSPDFDSPSSMWDRRPTAGDILAAIAAAEDAPDDDDDDEVDGGGGRGSVDDLFDVPILIGAPAAVGVVGDYEDEDEGGTPEIAAPAVDDGEGVVVSPAPRPRPPSVIVDGGGGGGDGRASAARSPFSQRGEEARTRAIARQRRILSRAGDRLDAISETSLAGIGEAEITAAIAGASEGGGRSVATASEYGSVRSSVTHNRRIVGEDGTDGGEISSIVFYESPTMMRLAAEDASRSRWDRGAESPTWAYNPAVVTPTASEENADDGDVAVRLSASVQNDADDSHNEDNIFDMQFFVLLLCPTSRIFELVDVASFPADEKNCATIIAPQSTIDDVLNAVAGRCTDARLLMKKYVGFVRACDRTEFVDAKRKAFVKHRLSSSLSSPNFEHEGEHSGGIFEGIDFIRENDVLVGILEGYTGHQMAKISKPILRNSKFREMIRRRSRKFNASGPNGTGVSDAGVRTRRIENRDPGKWDGDDNKSTRSNGNKSACSSQRRWRHRHATKHGVVGSTRQKRGSAVVTVDDLIGSRRDDDEPLIDCEISVGRIRTRRVKNNPSSSKKAAASVVASKAAPSSSKTDSIRYSSLCQKLEQLSKKLHDVDDEIGHDAPNSSSAVAPDRLNGVGQEHVDEVVFNKTAIVTQDDVSACNTNFKMTPKMVAYELAMNIEEIFADHDVEIVAVDADEEGSDLDSAVDDADNDDDTFFSSRSMRSSALSARLLGRKFDCAVVSDEYKKKEDQDRPMMLEFITKKKDRKMRKFDVYGEREEDDLMLQIEAMARQADAAFECRNTVVSATTTVVIEPGTRIVETTIDGNRELETRKDTAEEEIGIIADEIVQDYLEQSFDDENDISTLLSNTESINKKERRGSTSRSTNKTKNDALSRNFLNASTSMVSTMVATSQGRVNEVHVLQYLGVTIVCIAANFMEQNRGRGTTTASPSSTVKAVFQSAMFLAFVANGQRYLAKVTKKP